MSLIEELAEVSGLSVIAVGTTSVRTLESLYHAGCLVWSGQWDGTVPQWYPYSETHPGLSVSESMRALAGYLREAGRSVFVGSTRLLIAPGYKYRVVDGMVTNFHQPRSTLLLLVSAMIGDEWKRMYGYARLKMATVSSVMVMLVCCSAGDFLFSWIPFDFGGVLGYEFFP